MSSNNERDRRTKYILKQFRRAMYSLMVFEAELRGMRKKSACGSGVSAIEEDEVLDPNEPCNTNMKRCMEGANRCRKMVQLVKNALETVRNDPDRGEVYYQVLYETYCNPHKPKNREEIFDRLEELGFLMAPSTYHLYLRNAIHAVDTFLWDYSIRDTEKVMNSFILELPVKR